MKRYLFIVVLVFLFSCEEEQYYCWKCDTTAKGITTSITTCEKSYSEIRDFEMALRLQAMAMTDSLVNIVCNKTTCK
jgi:hypothetical protein